MNKAGTATGKSNSVFTDNIDHNQPTFTIAHSPLTIDDNNIRHSRFTIDHSPLTTTPQ
ncbi:MAG: hypothetical protein ABIN01_09030 [Ferruginibacter sp.]